MAYNFKSQNNFLFHKVLSETVFQFLRREKGMSKRETFNKIKNEKCGKIFLRI